MAATAALPNPKAPSSLIKVARWTFLSVGVIYGFLRNRHLKKIEDYRRCVEEAGRPAREAAAKAERERKSLEEMAYLMQQVRGSGTGSKCEHCGCEVSKCD